ncbi:MAG TPA: DNA translocase FtsK 4TM domain-containing protein [Solirubrobacteraceae bacterium]|jgi:S-DNA-T family DNA segregation ATPase FtsK/SpoIIIE|nr:DNA translocase FtsK 4TM domain-containing protein [Solirubrobacteraceae bacterium]
MATRKKTGKKPAKKPARKPARRPAPRRFGGGLWLRLPMLEQRHFDLVGLALVALGVFLAFVFYGDWSGGQVGGALADGLRYLVGVTAYVVPAALVAGGAIVVLRPFLPNSRPFASGAVCLFAALTLALAAGTFGLGPGGAHADDWSRAFIQPRGGVVGEALYSAAAPAVQSLGAHVIALFLFLAALLLLTGATIAGVVHALRTGLVGTGRVLRDSTSELGAALHRRDPGAVAAGAPLAPPEPGDRELVIKATHVEAPPLDAATRFPELFGRTEDGPPEDAPTAEERLEDEPEEGLEPADGEAVEGIPEEPDEPGVTRRDDAPAPAAGARSRSSITEDPDFDWRVPQSKLLTRSTAAAAKPDTTGQEKTAATLLEALGHFGVDAKVVGTVTGPHITRYELRLAPGTKVAKVAQLKDDLAYALAATEIRILAPIPGKQAVGVEVPNHRRRIVHLGDVFQDPPEDWSPLTVWLGKDVSGKAIGADLARMPHLLVAGTTGAGKSGAINAMLASILLRATPHDVRLVLVDPKQVELNHYDSIPHLLTPVITSPRMAANALGNLVREMETRYGEMSIARTRSLVELNRVRTGRGERALPYVLCVIDELADLMMVAPADVEDAVIRLAQKARAVGIHLVLATQSPRVDVITGMIKANVPSRIAFAVSSQTDSRVILDQNGAESLLGMGDMLFLPLGTSKLQRIQGAYVDEDQIAAITDFWRRQGEPEFHDELLEEVESEDSGGGGDDEFDPDEDPLLGEAIALVAQMGTASTSMLQRRLRLGYTRAGRLIDMLERRGVISGYEGSKPRQVLIAEGDVPRVLSNVAEAGGGKPERVAAEPDDA